MGTNIFDGQSPGHNVDMVTSAIQEKARDAYKLLKRNYRLDSLRIHLDLSISDNTVCLPIEFINTGDATMHLVFGNANGEVEQGQIVVTDARGSRVLPKQRMRIDNREDDLTVIEIGSASRWVYTVQGTLAGDVFSLRGVEYDLQLGEAYRIQYRYPFDRTQDHVSNVVTLHVASIEKPGETRLLATPQIHS